MCVCMCVCNHGNNVPFRLSPQWICGNSHALGHMMYGLLVAYCTHLAYAGFEQFVSRGSLLTNYIYTNKYRALCVIVTDSLVSRGC